VAVASRFEDLRAWQAARGLTIKVCALLRRREFSRDFALGDQIRRAAVSTMNNIAEGFDSASPTEFARFLRYASRSASEVQSCLHVARDQKYIDESQFDGVYAEAAVVRKLCVALIRSLTGRRKPSASDPRIGEPAPPAYVQDQSRCRREPAVRSSVPPLLVTGHRPPVTSLDRHE
jgi:four helix bundle protein